jgi:glycosyltransferase involved in cell wall biosynthesis
MTAGAISSPSDAWSDDPRAHPLARPGALTRKSTVLAVIPHFHCDAWLGQCLDSLLKQTHPLHGIVVIDDGTGSPPIDVVRQFPEVTLLASEDNVGPYRLSQQVIAATTYDAYCFQDADDWSMPARVERQLLEAERTGAEFVGCQGLRLISGEAEVVPLMHPLDVNATLETMPTRHVIMHPSSIVTRDLVMRAGGYAMGLRFGGDTEFEHRAVHVGRILNIPDFLYVVRNRPESLTSSAATGLESPERKLLRMDEHQRVQENLALIADGGAPNLEPLRTAEPTGISHLAGPRLRGASSETWPL